MGLGLIRNFFSGISASKTVLFVIIVAPLKSDCTQFSSTAVWFLLYLSSASNNLHHARAISFNQFPLCFTKSDKQARSVPVRSLFLSFVPKNPSLILFFNYFHLAHNFSSYFHLLNTSTVTQALHQGPLFGAIKQVLTCHSKVAGSSIESWYIIQAVWAVG